MFAASQRIADVRVESPAYLGVEMRPPDDGFRHNIQDELCASLIWDYSRN